MDDLSPVAQVFDTCNIEVLAHVIDGEVVELGVRLRAYRKDWPPGIMVLGQGLSFAEAMRDAIEKATSYRWEKLDWAKRPWRTENGAGNSGLKAPPTR